MLSEGWTILASATAGLRAPPVGTAEPWLGMLGLLLAAGFIALVAGLPRPAAEQAPDQGEGLLAWIDALDRPRLVACTGVLLAVGVLNALVAWAAWADLGLRGAFGLLAVAAACLLGGGGLGFRLLRQRAR